MTRAARRSLPWAGVFAAMALMWTAQLPAQGCRVEVIPVSFGAYDPARRQPSLARGEILLSCGQSGETPQAPRARLRLSGPPQRSLQGAGAALHYSLFQDAALQRPWWDGAVLELAPRLQDGRSSELRAPVYALLPAGQWVPAGTYQDLVQLSVEF